MDYELYLNMDSIEDFQVNCPACGEINKPIKRGDYSGTMAVFGFVFVILGIIMAEGLGLITSENTITALFISIVVSGYIGVKAGAWYTEKKYGILCPVCEYNFASDFRLLKRSSNSHETEERRTQSEN